MGSRRLWCSVTDSGILNKNWKRKEIKKLLRKLQETGLLDRLMGSGRPRMARTLRSCVVQPGAVAD